MKVLVMNGPNLNLLGKREPSLYGTMSFEQVLDDLKNTFPEVEVQYVQYNSEYEMIADLQSAEDHNCHGIILNPAAFSHTSLALADAVAAINVPVVEVHISNIFARETIRQHSYVSKYAKGVIVGFGIKGYTLAMYYLLRC